MHAQALLHDRLHEVVAAELAGHHDPPDLCAELRVVLHVPAEDVTDADVDELEVVGEHLACVPFPLPWTPMITYLRTMQACHLVGEATERGSGMLAESYPAIIHGPHWMSWSTSESRWVTMATFAARPWR